MTFTSFNPVQIQQSNIAQKQPLTLKQGQVLHGTIKKLYPDQIAEVQIGGHKLLAKLESPLKVGDSHFLQVTSISPQAELKVVTGPMNASTSMGQQIHQLLDTLNLPKTADMVQIVSHLIKEQLPISKEQILQAQGWLSLTEGQSKQDGLASLQKMIELKLPFTKEVFHAILNGSKTNGMTEDIDSLAKVLIKDSSISDKAKSTILPNLERISKPLDTEKGALILSRAVQSLLSDSEPIANKLHALNLLKQSSIIPREATLTNWMQTQGNLPSETIENQHLQYAGKVVLSIQKMNDQNAANILNQIKSWVNSESILSSSQKSEIMSLINRFEILPKQTQNIEQFAKQLSQLLLKSYSSSIIAQPFTQQSNGPSANTQLLSLMNQEAILNESNLISNIAKVTNESTIPQIQNINQQVELQMKAALDGNAIQQSIKTILQSLGINYESALNQKFLEVEQISDQLKPQLLSILKDGFASAPLKEAAEVLLSRMNGMQLLSGENGHQHQIVMQIPLQFFGKSMDATLQWNGRMKENGKIDSNYARILFYLEMESLKETVVDMQVQNRIVTITLFNEHENLLSLAEPFQDILKKRLSEKGYILSGFFFKTLGKSGVESREKIIRNEKMEEEARFNGVDIRI